MEQTVTDPQVLAAFITAIGLVLVAVINNRRHQPAPQPTKPIRKRRKRKPKPPRQDS
jgi:hypothetical protein